MATIQDILAIKGATIHRAKPTATVRNAVESMCAARVGALLVVDDEQPVGVLSERDILVRIILDGRSPDTTLVSAVMTKDIICVAANASPEQAMAMMTERRCRHLPVVDGGRVVGIVSIGDLVRWASRNTEFELECLRDYLMGPISSRSVA